MESEPRELRSERCSNRPQEDAVALNSSVLTSFDYRFLDGVFATVFVGLLRVPLVGAGLEEICFPISFTSESNSGSSRATFIASAMNLACCSLVCKPLTFGPFEGFFRPGKITDSKRHAVVIAEIKLAEIAMEVAFGAMLVNAPHAALEDGEVGLNVIGSDITASVLAEAMDDAGLLVYEIRGHVDVELAFVSVEAGVLQDMLTQDAQHIGLCRAGDMKGTDGAMRLGQRNDGQFVATPGFDRSAFLTAPIGLVSLDNATAASKRREGALPHGLPDTVGHEPSGLEGHAERPRKLIAAHALLAAAKEERRLQPEVQRDVAGLKDRSDGHGEWAAAGVAFVKARPRGFPAHEADARAFPAPGACRAMQPEQPFQILPRRIRGSEMGLRKLAGRRRFWRRFHGWNVSPWAGYVKYNVGSEKGVPEPRWATAPNRMFEVRPQHSHLNPRIRRENMKPEYEPKTREQFYGLVVEECGEVLAAAGKTLRWGELSYNPELPREQREFNIEWLRREMKDLRGAMDRLEKYLDDEFVVEPLK